MQHAKAGFIPDIGHDIPVVHVPVNDEHRQPQAGQGKSGRLRRFLAAGIVQVSAKYDHIGINLS